MEREPVGKRRASTSLPESRRPGPPGSPAPPVPTAYQDSHPGPGHGSRRCPCLLRLRDTYVAIREIEERLGQVNAWIIEKQHREEGEFLKAEIAAQNVAAFLERLEAIGRVNAEKSPLTFQLEM